MICLVQDAITKRVDGVGVKKPDGTVIYVKANKGVLLAPAATRAISRCTATSTVPTRIYNGGSPVGPRRRREDGDGHRRQLWHMDNHTMCCGYFHGIKVPDYETASSVSSIWSHGGVDGNRRRRHPLLQRGRSPISAST